MQDYIIAIYWKQMLNLFWIIICKQLFYFVLMIAVSVCHSVFYQNIVSDLLLWIEHHPNVLFICITHKYHFKLSNICLLHLFSVIFVLMVDICRYWNYLLMYWIPKVYLKITRTDQHVYSPHPTTCIDQFFKVIHYRRNTHMHPYKCIKWFSFLCFEIEHQESLCHFCFESWQSSSACIAWLSGVHFANLN